MFIYVIDYNSVIYFDIIHALRRSCRWHLGDFCDLCCLIISFMNCQAAKVWILGVIRIYHSDFEANFDKSLHLK